MTLLLYQNNRDGSFLSLIYNWDVTIAVLQRCALNTSVTRVLTVTHPTLPVATFSPPLSSSVQRMLRDVCTESEICIGRSWACLRSPTDRSPENTSVFLTSDIIGSAPAMQSYRYSGVEQINQLVIKKILHANLTQFLTELCQHSMTTFDPTYLHEAEAGARDKIPRCQEVLHRLGNVHWVSARIRNARYATMTTVSYHDNTR